MSASSSLERVAIDLGDRSYNILIGEQLLDAPSTWADLPKAAAALIVTNDTVGPMYAARLQAALAPLYKQVHTVTLPDGESHSIIFFILTAGFFFFIGRTIQPLPIVPAFLIKTIRYIHLG